MTPCKVKVCTCKHCKAVKNRKSTKLKKRIKRMVNKLRRTKTDCYKTHYWA